MIRWRAILGLSALPSASRASLQPDVPRAVHTALVAELGHARSVMLERQRATQPGTTNTISEGDRLSEPSLRARLRLALQPPQHRAGHLRWPQPLFEFQQEGVAALLARKSLLLADEMGLGKTIQAIAALRLLRGRGDVTSALIVCPAGLLAQWRRELRTWAAELQVTTVRGAASDRAWQWRSLSDVHLVSYETLRSDATESPISAPRRRLWDVVVLDEAQKIKNPEADVTKACKGLNRKRSWALSGTPLENKIEDLVSICEFLTPPDAGHRQQRLSPGPELLERHREIQLRRRKRDVVSQLPPKTVITVDLELSGPQRIAYERAEAEGMVRLRALGPEIRVSNLLELITRLKQLCNVDPSTGQSVKLDDLRERMLVITAQGDRALVFSQYTSDQYGVGFIASSLADFAPLAYTGAMPTEQRDRVVRRFIQDQQHRLLVLSLRAGGQGLNLQQASYVFHFDRWWNPAVERQAEDRSHRMGQTMPVTVYAYRCLDTIEQRIDDVLQSKQRLFDAFVDDVSLEIEKALTGDELFGLFGLERPQP